MDHESTIEPSDALPAELSIPDGLGELFAQLAGQLFRTTTVIGVLENIVDTGKLIVPGADLVSVTLRIGDEKFTTPVRTDELALRFDEIQYTTGQGPCLDATRVPGLGVVASDDLCNELDWPDFGPAVAALGVASVLAVGLFPGDSAPRSGALNFYSHRADGLRGADRDIALVLAAHASTALAATRSVAEAELRVAHLERALESRDVIGQAKGILMERRNLSADQAFDVLRRASQQLNVKLTEIAAAVTERRDIV